MLRQKVYVVSVGDWDTQTPEAVFVHKAVAEQYAAELDPRPVYCEIIEVELYAQPL